MLDIAKVREAAATYAEAQIGKPYSQPKRLLAGWYDCSSLDARAYIAAGYQWGTKGAPVPLSLYIPYDDGFELVWPAEYADIGRTLPTPSSLLGSLALRRGDLMAVAWASSTRFNHIEHITMLTSPTRIVHARGTAYGVRRDAASLYGKRVAAVVRFNPLCDLRRGHRGRRVKALQGALNNVALLAACLDVDGEFGGATEAAVRACQRIKGLPITGRGDAATRAALGVTDEYMASDERPMLEKGDIGDYVREMQARLVANGYKIDVDGEFGPLTDKAVRAFQAAQELTVDGQCGPITWSALLDDPGDIDSAEDTE